MQIYLCEDIKAHAIQMEELLVECAKENNIHIEIQSFEQAEKLLKDLRQKKDAGEFAPILLLKEVSKVFLISNPQICVLYFPI